jgi:hypothetical protein
MDIYMGFTFSINKKTPLEMIIAQSTHFSENPSQFIHVFFDPRNWTEHLQFVVYGTCGPESSHSSHAQIDFHAPWTAQQYGARPANPCGKLVSGDKYHEWGAFKISRRKTINSSHQSPQVYSMCLHLTYYRILPD